MQDSLYPHDGTPSVRLGIQGLPNLTNCLIKGGLYAMIAETPPARFPVIGSSLAAAIDDCFVCSVVLPSHPDMFVERLKSFGNLDMIGLMNAGRLNVFEMQDEFLKKMFRFGADSFVRELEQFDIPENSYMVFDQADELLALHDISIALDQLDVLRKWFEHRGITALLVFCRATASHIATINALMDSLTGITRLVTQKNGLELSFDYWQAPEGTIAAKSYALQRQESGFYELGVEPAPTERTVVPAVPGYEPETPEVEPHFFYMDPDLGSLAQQLPGIWQRVDTLVGMMHATRTARSATLILTFQRDTRIRLLAEAVHTLRLSLGKSARIVVREKDASLRYQNEALLLRLGVNLVVHRDVAATRLPLLLESLRGQVFNRDVNINFEEALACVLPTRLRGYLSPARFVREVELILARAETLSVPYALVVARAKAPEKIEEILSGASVSRAGDLISSDGQQCFVFLNACPQPALLQTLQRIFGTQFDELFDDVRFHVVSEEVGFELAGITRAVERNDLPDYSQTLSLPAEAEEPAEAPEEHAIGMTENMPPPVDTYTSRHTSPRAMPAQPKAAPVPSVPADVVSAFPAEEQPVGKARYAYGDTPAENKFGKREAPRAVRRTAHASAQVQTADAVSPTSC